jgi:hypothetical protein
MRSTTIGLLCFLLLFAGPSGCGSSATEVPLMGETRGDLAEPDGGDTADAESELGRVDVKLDVLPADQQTDAAAEVGGDVEAPEVLLEEVQGPDEQGPDGPLTDVAEDTPPEEVLPEIPADIPPPTCESDEDCAFLLEQEGNECVETACDMDSGTCVLSDLPDGLACTLEDFCLKETVCSAGECTGKPIACEDDNLCTDDGCDPAFGCTFTPNEAPCDDANPCTAGEACADGDCSGGMNICECGGDLDCADKNQDDLCIGVFECVDGACQLIPGTPVICDPPAGDGCGPLICNPGTAECEPDPLPDGTKCDDGNICTQDEECSGGLCTGGSTVTCDDKNPCTSDACAPGAGCVFVPNNNPCDDQDKCTAGDACSGGSCTPGPGVSCDDKNQCTFDSCVPAVGCASVPEPDNTTCDDASECTGGDRCLGGTCTGDAIPCDDGNPCTDDKCSVGVGCYYLANSNACDDSNVCTVGDLCQNKACVGQAQLPCDDGNQCTDDLCDAAGGCFHPYKTGGCEDGDLCTTKDTCVNGNCVAGIAVVCDDANLCTDDSCYPGKGCINAPNSLACDDKNLCTEGDICAGGKCTSGKPLDCLDGNVCTDDACNPASGCIHTNNTLPCDDKAACTTNDVCTNGVCKGSGGPNCDDGNPCTTDSCEPGTGCTNTNNANPCDDGDSCTTNDVCAAGKCAGTPMACDDGNICTNDTCLAPLGCIYTYNTVACEDGNLCTLGDVCAMGVCKPGPQLKVCDDYNACTTDSCTPAAGACSFALSPTCPSKPLPVYDSIPCGDLNWTASPAVGGVGWAIDATPANPGMLTDTCSLNYNDGTAYPGTTSGLLTSTFQFDATPVPGQGFLTLTFHSFNGTDAAETLPTKDLRKVQLSSDGFNTILFEKVLPVTDNRGKWVIEAFDVGVAKGKRFQVRFVFDSVDGSLNSGSGWFVEDVNVYAGPIVTVTPPSAYNEPFAQNNPHGWQMSVPVGQVGWAIDSSPQDPGRLEGNASLNFNDGTDFQPNPSQTVAGSALSPVIDLTGVALGTPVSFLFRSWFQTELSDTVDKRFVEVSTLAFTKNEVAVQLSNTKGGQGGWTFEAVDLSALAGTKFRLRFRFDSVDANNNTGKGWFIDAGVLATRPLPVFSDGLVCSDKTKWGFANSQNNVVWAIDASPEEPGYYSDDCSLNFNNGKNYSCGEGSWTPVSGTATSVPFVATAPPQGMGLFLTFQAANAVEQNLAHDITTVTVFSTTDPTKTVSYTLVPHSDQWISHSIDITALAGQTVRIAIKFDSIDCNWNSGDGPFIDDVLVQAK